MAKDDLKPLLEDPNTTDHDRIAFLLGCVAAQRDRIDEMDAKIKMLAGDVHHLKMGGVR